MILSKEYDPADRDNPLRLILFVQSVGQQEFDQFENQFDTRLYQLYGMTELFPANVRYTGLSLGYQVAAAIVGFGLMLSATTGDRFGAAPYLFGGFMICGLLLSLILSIFSPDTRTFTQYEVHAELGDLEEPELKVTPSGKQLNY